MADVKLYDDYFPSLIDKIRKSYDCVSYCEQVVIARKEEMLYHTDGLIAQLERSFRDADALFEKAEVIANRAEAKAHKARCAIRPLPPKPIAPTQEQKAKDPSCMSTYHAQCAAYEQTKQRNAKNEARAAAMESTCAEVRQYACRIAEKRDGISQVLTNVRAAKERFPCGLTYLSKTKYKLEAFSNAVSRSSDAADRVLGCNCDRVYNSFLKFNVPEPYDTAKIGYRFRMRNGGANVKGSPAFTEYVTPEPMGQRENGVGGCGEITIQASTVSQFLADVENNSQATTVYVSQFCLKLCGKNAVIQKMQALGYRFTDDESRPHFDK